MAAPTQWQSLVNQYLGFAERQLGWLQQADDRFAANAARNAVVCSLSQALSLYLCEIELIDSPSQSVSAVLYKSRDGEGDFRARQLVSLFRSDDSWVALIGQWQQSLSEPLSKQEKQPDPGMIAITAEASEHWLEASTERLVSVVEEFRQLVRSQRETAAEF